MPPPMSTRPDFRQSVAAQRAAAASGLELLAALKKRQASAGKSSANLANLLALAIGALEDAVSNINNSANIIEAMQALIDAGPGFLPPIGGPDGAN